MFWDSVVHGLSVLLHWQTYVAMLEFVAINLLPNLLFGLAMMRLPYVAAMGCLMPIVLAIFQMLAVFVFVMTLAPIIFGGTDGAAWMFPWTFIGAAPWLAFKLMAGLLFVGIVLAFFQMHLFGNAILGCLVLAILANGIGDHFGIAGTSWPGFWLGVGILAISAVLFVVGAVLAAGITSLFGENGEALGQLVAQPLVSVLMFLPVFIYGGWLLQQGNHG